MGRRRRRVIKTVRRTLPKVFSCPRCGVISVKISKDLESKIVVACGSCGLKQEYGLSGREESIDIYNRFVDEFMTGNIRV